MTEPEMIDSLRVHRFEPGDRLLVTMPSHARQEDYELMKAVAEKWSGVSALVVSAEIKVEVARGLPEFCSICHEPLGGSKVGTGDGAGNSFAHIECYRGLSREEG